MCVTQQNTETNTLTTNDYENKANVVSRPETLLHLHSFVSIDEIIKLAWYKHASGVGTSVWFALNKDLS